MVDMRRLEALGCDIQYTEIGKSLEKLGSGGMYANTWEVQEIHFYYDNTKPPIIYDVPLTEEDKKICYLIGYVPFRDFATFEDYLFMWRLVQLPKMPHEAKLVALRLQGVKVRDQFLIDKTGKSLHCY